MTGVPLSIALNPGPMTRPILDGDVTADGVRWAASGLHPSEMFWRQLRFGDFDISEMSLSALLQDVAGGGRAWTGLPVFTTRTVCHTDIIVRAGADIAAPPDLAGKRIGVPEYQQTSAVWSRGVLRDEHGVDPRDITWYMERGDAVSHAGGTGFRPPDSVTVHGIPAAESIGSLLAAGTLDSSLLYLSDANLVDRSPDSAALAGRVHRLFGPDEARRYVAANGFRHATHCVVIRTELAQRFPWLTLNVYAAFERAKQLMIDRAMAAAAPWDVALDGDPLPSGLAGQRPMLATLCRYAHEQGITARPVEPEELFDPRTTEL